MESEHIEFTRTVVFFGGPLDGLEHPIRHPWGSDGAPAKIGLPFLDGLAWYALADDGRYRFEAIERE